MISSDGSASFPAWRGFLFVCGLLAAVLAGCTSSDSGGATRAA